jgi:hypothetical protein
MRLQHINCSNCSVGNGETQALNDRLRELWVSLVGRVQPINDGQRAAEVVSKRKITRF